MLGSCLHPGYAAAMRARAFLSVILLVLACGPETIDSADAESPLATADALKSCKKRSISVTGSFEPSGNSTTMLDSLFQAQNPVVRIVAIGSSLTLTSRNGEVGTLTLSGATVGGTVIATEAQGLNAFRVMSASTLGVSSVGPYQELKFRGASLSAPFDGFQFLDPLFTNSSWATRFEGVGNAIVITDVFGASASVTLACK